MELFNIKKHIYFVLALVLVFSSSCSGIKIPNVNRNVEEYKRSEAMIFVSQLKNEYESTFGGEIWNLTSGDGKTRYETYVIGNVKKYLEVIKTLNLYFSTEVENSSKVITSTVNSQIMRISQEYLDGLSQGDRDYIGCSLEDVLKMYTEYYKACYVIEYALRNEDDEISVSESKVIRVDQIVMSDKEKAYSIREELNQRGANFAYFARQYSESDVVSLKIERGDELSGMFPETFLLDNGEMSDVIEFNKKY
jgi:foldase protein PrsA